MFMDRINNVHDAIRAQDTRFADEFAKYRHLNANHRVDQFDDLYNKAVAAGVQFDPMMASNHMFDNYILPELNSLSTRDIGFFNTYRGLGFPTVI